MIIQDNITFLSVFTAWLTAQTIKVIVGIIREKRFNFKWFVGTGGMPSSHAAAVCGMVASLGYTYGVEAPIFTLGLLIAIIVITDAQGVRRSSGKQAEILNMILDDIYWKKKIHETRLKELLGHTPFEVLVGGIVGVLVVTCFYLKYFWQ